MTFRTLIVAGLLPFAALAQTAGASSSSARDPLTLADMARMARETREIEAATKLLEARNTAKSQREKLAAASAAAGGSSAAEAAPGGSSGPNVAPTRKPAPPPKVEEPAPATPTLSAIQIVGSAQTYRLMFNNATYTVRQPGDMVGPWRVTSLDSRSVGLASGKFTATARFSIREASTAIAAAAPGAGLLPPASTSGAQPILPPTLRPAAPASAQPAPPAIAPASGVATAPPSGSATPTVALPGPAGTTVQGQR